MPCDRCPVPPGHVCLGPALGLCALLEGPDAAAWARHVVARSQLPPPGVAPAPAAPPPARIGPRLALVFACDRRGHRVEGPTGCGCAPKRRCADGRDVTLADCLACVSRVD